MPLIVKWRSLNNSIRLMRLCTMARNKCIEKNVLIELAALRVTKKLTRQVLFKLQLTLLGDAG